MPIFGVRSGSFLEWMVELIRGKRLASERYILDLREKDTSSEIDWQVQQRVLDVGSGRLRPQLQLLVRGGHQVSGVDLANDDAWSVKSAAYVLARLIFAGQLEFSRLRAKAGGKAQLVAANVEKLPFADSSFDVISSVAAFEHFDNPEVVLAELWRVLRPGGVVWLWIHNYTALSGGHNAGNSFPPLKQIPPGMEPWDHLRKRREAISVPLNGWRMGKYLEAVSERFQVLKEYVPITEGEGYLSADVEAELKEYKREELLAAAYVIVGKKRVEAST